MKQNYYKENAWWASPYNDDPDVVEASRPKKPVRIHDATLRDGEQTPGVVFTKDEKVRIAEKLIEIGIDRVEAGMPAVSELDREAITEICRRNPDANIYTFARMMRQDIDMARDCGAKGVILEIPIGYPKLKHQFHWTWENVLEKSIDGINYARSQGLDAVFFPYDTTRARPEDLEALIPALVKEAPPSSIGVVDTMGCALPQSVALLVRKVKSLSGGLPIEIHTHNDFGLALATELAAVAAGAEVVHGCVNGLGERTGNAATEELAVALRVLLGIDNGYDLPGLQSVCQLVSEYSGIAIPRNKPIIGSQNYTRESGIGIDLVINEPLAMFATDPGFFGKQGQVVLGKKSGKRSVELYLKKMGYTVDDEQIPRILNMVKDLGIRKKALLTDEDFLNIVTQFM